jgi:hypothetical protein
MQILFALICHMIGYQMSWAATLKSVEASNFFKEVPDILRKFKITLTTNFLIIVSTCDSPAEWNPLLILVSRIILIGRYGSHGFLPNANRLESE